MALFQITLSSKVLRRETMIHVILPNARTMDERKEIYDFEAPLPVLYLLHGAGGNHMDYIRYTSVESLADKYQTTVVMPSAELGFYTDMYRGDAFFTYVSKELPAYLRKVLPLSEKREDTYIAGLSMGGYGALKIALSCPKNYCAAASMSGVLDVGNFMKNKELTDQIQLTEVLERCYKDIEGALAFPNNLLLLLEKLKTEGTLPPRIFQCVGTEDFLYSVNQDFKRGIQQLDIPFTYREEPGMHDWTYWERNLKRVFQWLFEGE